MLHGSVPKSELCLDWNDNLAAIFEDNLKPNWRAVPVPFYCQFF